MMSGGIVDTIFFPVVETAVGRLIVEETHAEGALAPSPPTF